MAFKDFKKINSSVGNRTLIIRATGGNTNHYTTEDAQKKLLFSSIYEFRVKFW